MRCQSTLSSLHFQLINPDDTAQYAAESMESHDSLPALQLRRLSDRCYYVWTVSLQTPDISCSGVFADFEPSDTGSFGSLQALPSFLNTFGVEDGDGAMTLPATRRALMNSLPWIGKILGCFASDWFIDRTGYKNTMFAAAAIQTVGVIRELQLAPCRICLV